MKNDIVYEDSDDLDFLDELDEPLFHKDIMIQKLEKKKKLALPEEISLRKKKINRMFNLRFGKHFVNIKPESLIVFENQLKDYFFSPNSKFLYNFPSLRKKLLFDKKINYDKLSTKIDIGSLLYLSEAEKKKKIDENKKKNEKILAFSKNFATQITKDVITSEIYKVKFWDKNANRIKKYLSKRLQEISDNINNNSSDDEEEDKKGNYNRYYSQTQNNNLRNDNLNLMDHISFNKNNNENEKLEENNLNLNTNNTEANINNNNYIRKYTNSPLNLHKENNKSNIMKSPITNLKLFNINKLSLKNKNKNNDLKLINESSLPSLSLNANTNIYDVKKNNTNHMNKSEFKSVSRNDKRLKKFSNIQFQSIHKNSKNSLNKELMESTLKYKRNLTKQVKELNSHTIKCNLKLYKLIDGNYTIKSTEKIKKINKEFDINNDLSDTNIKKNTENKEKNKSFMNYYEYEKYKLKNQNDNSKINSLIKEVKNNLSAQNKFRKRELKLFPKRIYKMKDDYALEMVERLYSAHKINREKAPEIKEVIKEDREIKHKKKVITLRKKTKSNHEKIVKMGLFLTMEKDKFFKNHKKLKKK